MQLTENEKSNLRRFGCSLDLREGVLNVMWSGLTKDQALAAIILVRCIYTKPSSGPLLGLALEISPTLPMVRYCFFPLNPQDHKHSTYLSSLAESGQLHLAFITEGETISRLHRLSPTDRRRMKELFVEAGEALNTCANYQFADAVRDFENTVRIPEFFERALSPEELADALRSIQASAENIPAEKRLLAQQLVRGVGAAVKGRFGDTIREKLSELRNLKKGFLFLLDLQREFGTDYDRFVGLIADIVATGCDDDTLRNSRDWPSKVEVLLRLVDDATPENHQHTIQHRLTLAIGNVLSELGSGGRISFSKLKTLLQPLQPYLFGQPGRPTKDYSREYDWKASGLSWTEVASQHLEQNLVTRTEFGGRDFAALTFEEKENLKNRVREGVRSYAERTGKPFPLPEPPSTD